MGLKKIRLGEVIDVHRGMSLLGEFYSKEGKYIRLTAGNFDYVNNCFKDNTSKSDIYYTGKIRESCLLKKDDIITPMTEQVKGLIGSTAFIPIDNLYILSNDIGLITCSEKIDKNYCYYLISSAYVKNQLSNMAQQTKIRHTSPDKIKSVFVMLPDIKIQKKIANLLLNIDAQIKRNNDMCQKLQDLILTKYSVNYTQNKKNGLLKDICSLPSGYSFKPTMYVPNGKYKLITIKNVSNLFVDTTKVDYIDSLPKNLKDYCILSEGDILMSLTGNVGRISIVFEKNNLLNQRVSLIQADKNYKTYIYALLLSQKYQSIMQNLARGTSQKNLSPIDVENLQIYIPTNIVSFYENTINYFDEMISIQKATYELSLLKETLLPLLINGQLVV